MSSAAPRKWRLAGLLEGLGRTVLPATAGADTQVWRSAGATGTQPHLSSEYDERAQAKLFSFRGLSQLSETRLEASQRVRRAAPSTYIHSCYPPYDDL